MEIHLEKELLARVQGVQVEGLEAWRSVNLLITNIHIAITDSETNVEGLRIPRDSFLAAKLKDSGLLTVLAIPRLKHRRVYVEVYLEADEDDLCDIQNTLHRLQYTCPERNKLLVFLNPFSGTRRAVEKWDKVDRLLQLAGVSVEKVVTERANHAMELVQNMNLDQYSAIVTVSGDGLIHEVLNGLCMRKDWELLRKRFPIGVVPGGSGNAIHCSLLHEQGEDFRDELSVAGLNLARGETTPADYIECETEDRRFLSMFGVAWGLIPDCDIRSEVIRWAGFARVYLWLFLRILSPRFYSGKVHYLPAHQGLETTSLPDLDDPVPPSWTTVQGEFLTVYACRQSWLDYSTILVPHSKLSDGAIHLVMIPRTSRLNMVAWLMDTARHADGVQIIPVSAFRFEMDAMNDPLTVDAEELHCTKVQGRIVKQGCQVLVKQKL